MANKSTIAIELVVNDNGSVTIKKFGAEAEKSLKQAESAGAGLDAGLKKVWAGITAGVAAVTAAYLAIGKLTQFEEMGAKAQQAEETFRSVAASAGESADKVIASMNRAAAGTVDDSDIMQKAVKGMLQEFSGDQLTSIMEAARVAARVTGEDVKTAYATITDAIATNMPRALRQYGLITKEEISLVNKAMAAGVEEVNLYGIAMAHAAEQAAKMGEIHGNAAERIQKYNAVINDVEESLGKLTGTTKSYLLAGMYGIDALIVKMAANLGKLIGQTDAYDALMGLSNDLTKQRNALLGIQTEEEKKAAAAAAEGAKDKIAAAEAQLKAEREKLKALADQAEQVKISKKAYEDLITVTQKLGEARLNVAASGLDASLKQEDATIAQLKAGLDAYLATLQSVYAARIEGEKKIAEAIKNAGGKPEEAMKAQIEALKQEEKYYTDRLAGQQKYYDTLQALHSKATDAMKKKTEELRALEDSAAKQRAAHATQILGLQEKLITAQGKAASDVSIYEMKLKAIEAERSAAMKLSGDAQIRALEEVKNKYAALTGAVTTDSKVFDITTMKWTEGLRSIQTEEESVRKAMENVASVQRDITKATEAGIAAKKAEADAQKAWISDLETAMAAAKEQIDSYKGKVNELSQAIAQMEREIAISVIDNATGPIQKIKAELDQLQDKTINVTVNKSETVTQEVVTKVDFSPSQSGAAGSGDHAGLFNGGVYNGWEFSGVGGAGDEGITDHSGGYGGGTYSIPDGGGDYSGDYSGGDYYSSGYSGGGDGGGGGEYARGAAFYRGKVIPFARGGVFDRPTLFPMAKGMGLMAEAGEPEAVMPLARGRDGKLGVRSSGGPSIINVHFAAGSAVINGANKSAEQLTREIVRLIPGEVKRQLKSVGV